nr:ATP-binding protein [Picosynechococcus sp. PCC 7117]
MSRLEAGKLGCQRQAVDIVTLCQDLIAELKIGLGKQHHFNLETTGAIAAPLALDPNLLQHILNNLLGNACKYSAPGTTVTVQLGSSAEALTLSIIDQGVGIPPEDQPHIFESFYRASNTQNIPGTGLGLNIVKEYVQLHGGQIELTSQLSKGSQFTVTIPLAEGSPETARN